MKFKFAPLCPACQAPHATEVEPGTKITCPECDEVYRAEVPEVGTSTARARSAGSKKPAAKKKARRARSVADLGKLIEQFGAHQQRALLLTVAIAAGAIGLVVCLVGLVGVGESLQPWVLGGGGVLLLVAVVSLLLLRFGGSNSFVEIRKKGVRYVTRTTEQLLLWDDLDGLDIRREIVAADHVKYEVFLMGSETIHLTPAFLATLDDPLALIKALKRYSGKDFEMAIS